MTASKTPEAVLSAIPGWKGAIYSELTGGLTNSTYLIENGDDKAVLKIDEGSRGPPYNASSTDMTTLREITPNSTRGLTVVVACASDFFFFCSPSCNCNSGSWPSSAISSVDRATSAEMKRATLRCEGGAWGAVGSCGAAQPGATAEFGTLQFGPVPQYPK